jgi:hypothetical protein
VTVQNALTFTKYPGLDPEIQANANDTRGWAFFRPQRRHRLGHGACAEDLDCGIQMEFSQLSIGKIVIHYSLSGWISFKTLKKAKGRIPWRNRDEADNLSQKNMMKTNILLHCPADRAYPALVDPFLPGHPRQRADCTLDAGSFFQTEDDAVQALNAAYQPFDVQQHQQQFLLGFRRNSPPTRPSPAATARGRAW